MMFTTLDKTSKICYNFVDLYKRNILMTKKLCSFILASAAALGLATLGLGAPASAQDGENGEIGDDCMIVLTSPVKYKCENGLEVGGEEIKICQKNNSCLTLQPSHPLYNRIWVELMNEAKNRDRRPSRVRVKRPSPRVIPVPKQLEEGAPIGYPDV